ncbi:glycosyltransferase family 2 protein [Leptothoe kymatousa]|uniref:Glycosyltransferase n=1 Tax=Leptothoe kymatousa TAU-MAC 1615 TaxID=2364775 RepID=A0ABS5Y0K7_9CYAN|nr:glycosyltransferase [Leptothoe kymatousa]MBT9311367.1 glycosyltransferase [Leptothoe kymatousa TAU-MAC 1615]
MKSPEYSPLVTIIIVNYNYHQFLSQAIESALQQTYRNIEVIVVDDGSTDTSIEIISDYADRLITIKKQNGGQASAMNLGFAVSRGELVLFLDADDWLLSDAVQRFLTLINTEHKIISKAHAPLLLANEEGIISEKRVPKQPLSFGDLKGHILKFGPESYVCSPTSGNLWTRHFLEQSLPIPNKTYKTSADSYLFTLSPLFGETLAVGHPIGMYRVHGKNAYWNSTTQIQQLRTDTYRYLSRVKTLYRVTQSLQLPVQPTSWKLNNRYYLAKLVILARLQHRNLSFRLLVACLHSGLVAPISIVKRLGWMSWFFAIWFAPKNYIIKLAQPFFKLKTRL